MLKKLTTLSVIFCFFLTSLGITPQAHADILGLPAPGSMVNLSPAFEPVLIKGLKVNPKDPLALDFIVDTGNSNLKSMDPQLKTESEKLVKYFFAALTLPERDVWVNLSPYEKNRIIPQATGETEMGRDMLAQDYILKQITASLIYPQQGLGKEFWARVYKESYDRFGTTQIPVNTFNKVWIVADNASVYENGDTVLVINAHLKVMLEEDYLAHAKHQASPASSVSSQVVREVVLPALEREVNQGQNFANLRQIFHSLILAKWYKESLKTALLNQVYSNTDKIAGVDVADKSIKEKIYQEYLKAYKKGVFNFIKQDIDQTSKQYIPRKYFSGGVSAAMTIIRLSPLQAMRSMPGFATGRLLEVGTMAQLEKSPPPAAAAMTTDIILQNGYVIIKPGFTETAKDSQDRNVQVQNNSDGTFQINGAKVRAFHSSDPRNVLGVSGDIVFALDAGTGSLRLFWLNNTGDKLDIQQISSAILIKSKPALAEPKLKFTFGYESVEGLSTLRLLPGGESVQIINGHGYWEDINFTHTSIFMRRNRVPSLTRRDLENVLSNFSIIPQPHAIGSDDVPLGKVVALDIINEKLSRPLSSPNPELIKTLDELRSIFRINTVGELRSLLSKRPEIVAQINSILNQMPSEAMTTPEKPLNISVLKRAKTALTIGVVGAVAGISLQMTPSFGWVTLLLTGGKGLPDYYITHEFLGLILLTSYGASTLQGKKYGSVLTQIALLMSLAAVPFDLYMLNHGGASVLNSTLVNMYHYPATDSSVMSVYSTSALALYLVSFGHTIFSTFNHFSNKDDQSHLMQTSDAAMKTLVVGPTVDIIAEYTHVPKDKINGRSKLFDDLGLHSLEISEITANLQERFELPHISEEEQAKWIDVGDLVRYIHNLYALKHIVVLPVGNPASNAMSTSGGEVRTVGTYRDWGRLVDLVRTTAGPMRIKFQTSRGTIIFEHGANVLDDGKTLQNRDKLNHIIPESEFDSADVSYGQLTAHKNSAVDGGIDLNATRLSLQRNGPRIQMQFNQAMLNQFRHGNFSGINPVITSITDIPSALPLFGFKQSPQNLQLAKA